MSLNELIDVDLSSLESILLGNIALVGRDDSLCSLTLRSKNKLIRNDLLCRSSKSEFHYC